MKTLFDDQRLSMEQSIELTANSLNAYGSDKEWFPTLYEDGTLQPLLWDPIAL